MEPRREEQRPVERPPSEKQKRFHIVKLEERIAPRNGGSQGHSTRCGSSSANEASIE